MATKPEPPEYPWSDDVLIYFEGLWSRDGWPAKQRARGLAMITDKKLAKFAAQLEKISSPQTIAEFLAEAVTLPDIYDNQSHRQRDFHVQQMMEIQRGARSFLSMLRKHQEDCTALLISTSKSGTDPVATGRENLFTLKQLTRKLRRMASAMRKTLSSLRLPRMSRKRSVPEAKLIFYLQSLTQAALRSFGKPYHAEVGILAKHGLGLDFAIDSDRVKEVFRNSRRKRNKKGG